MNCQKMLLEKARNDMLGIGILIAQKHQNRKL